MERRPALAPGGAGPGGTALWLAVSADGGPQCSN